MGLGGSFSFTKSDRLLKRGEFLRISRFGKRVQNRYFIVAFSQARFEKTRLGITVTKRVGKAVTRNRIKRFVREYFRKSRHEIAGQWDINIIAKKEAAKLSWGEVAQSLQNVFGKILG